MYRQGSKKIIDQSYQSATVVVESTKGGMGNENFTYSKFGFISPLSSAEGATSFLHCLLFCSFSCSALQIYFQHVCVYLSDSFQKHIA